MRRLFLNLLSLSITLLLLGALTLPAMHILRESSDSQNADAEVPASNRLFGIAVDPWHIDDWSRAIGARPQLVAKFQAFSKRASIEPYLTETERQGVEAVMISWEPWQTVPAARGREAQFRPQPGYRNSDIARGEHDAYITRFARTLAGFRGTVYLRYAHEMNGIWYPWTHDPPAYRQAWRRMVRLFRQAGARNVRFVWSTNPNLYETEAYWVARMRRYWPGADYVDAVGSTTIDFGGQKDYSVKRFRPRLEKLHSTFRKPVMITEANTDFADRVRWLSDFRVLLQRSPWIHGVVWSQLPSRGKAQMPSAGELDWDAQRDPATRRLLRAIIDDGSQGDHAPPRPPPRERRSALP